MWDSLSDGIGTGYAHLGIPILRLVDPVVAGPVF
jgi:hypothetical protein